MAFSFLQLFSVTQQVARAVLRSKQSGISLLLYSRRKYTDGAVIQGPSQSLQLTHTLPRWPKSCFRHGEFIFQQVSRLVFRTYNRPISQGSVAKRLRCGEIFILNFLLNVFVKERWKSVNNLRIHGQEFGVLFFFDSWSRIATLYRFATIENVTDDRLYQWRDR